MERSMSDLKKAVGDFYHASTPSVGVLRLFLKEGKLPEETRIWIERLSKAYDILDAEIDRRMGTADSADAAPAESLDTFGPIARGLLREAASVTNRVRRTKLREGVSYVEADKYEKVVAQLAEAKRLLGRAIIDADVSLAADIDLFFTKPASTAETVSAVEGAK